MEIKPPTKIKIGNSPIHGLGVFSTTKITKGEIIERCPFLLFPQSNLEKIPVFANYSFCFPRSENWTNHAMVMGYGSFYNHSDSENVNWNTDKDTFIFFSTRDIEEGEELFINYANGFNPIDVII
jgi:SET domain-containing protein